MKTKEHQNYEDIIHFPRPISSKRAKMSMTERGAQFSPFAALVGYDAAIQETARLTECRRELTEGEIFFLNEKLQWICSRISQHPSVQITCFVPDDRKTGGSYVTLSGQVKKVDNYGKSLLLTDGRCIPFDDILSIDTKDARI